MKKPTFRIGPARKLAFGSVPYSASRGIDTSYSDGTEPLEWAIQAWLDTGRGIPLSPLLVAAPGVGVHRLVIELARRTNQSLYILQGHEELSAEDLACAVRFGDDDSSSLEYVISPLATAMLTGGIGFIDQLPRIRPRALALLVSVLDERRCMDSTLLGERIQAHERFRFIASATSAELHALPEFIRSRMGPLIRVGEWGDQPEYVDRYIPDTNVCLDHTELLKILWTLLCQLKESGQVPTANDSLRLFALASSLGDFDFFDDQGSPTQPQGSARPPATPGCSLRIDESHLKIAFEELYRQGRE